MSPTVIDWVEDHLARAPKGMVELAKLLSPAVVVEGALVRRIRLELLSDHPAAVEAELWFSSLVQAHTASRITFSVPVAVELRRRLSVEWFENSPGRRETLSRARQICGEVHAHLPPPLRLEDEMAWDLVTGDLAQASRRWDQAVAGYLAEPDQFRFWVTQAQARIGDVVSNTVRGSVVGLERSSELGSGPSWEAMYASLPTRPLTVAHVGALLELGGPVRPGTRRIDVPNIAILPLDLSWEGADGPETRHVVVDLSSPAGAVRLWAEGPVDVTTPSGMTYVVRDDPFRRPVRIADAADPDGTLRALLGTTGAPRGPVRAARPDEVPEFTVDVQGDGVVILDESGEPFPGVPALGRDRTDQRGPLAVVGHLSRWLTINEFRSDAPLLAGALGVTVSTSGEPPAGSVDVVVGGDVVADVTNLGKEALFVSMLLLGSDWSVSVLEGSESAMAPGESLRHTFQVGLGRSIPDLITVVAVGARDPFDLDRLYLPPLVSGNPPPPRPFPAATLLDSEMAAMLTVTEGPPERYDAWVTAEAVVRISREPVTEGIGGDRSFLGHTGEVNTLAFSPDGTTLATGGADRTIRLWDIASGLAVSVLETDGTVNTVAFSPDGRTLASGGSDRLVRVWDVRSASILRTFDRHTGAVNALAFTPDGQQVVSGGDDRLVWFWDVTGAQREQPEEQQGAVNAVALAITGALAVAGASGVVSLRRPDGRDAGAFSGHDGVVLALAFSSDGRTLASAGADGTVRLWDAESGRGSRVMEHGSVVNCVAFSPDGSVIASAGADRSVRLWDTATAIQLSRIDGHMGPVHAVAFAPDGEHVATAGADREVRLWSVADHLEPAVEPLGAPLAGRRLLLVVAAGRPSSEAPLTGAEDDVRRLRSAMEQRGFEVLEGFPGGASAAQLRRWVRSVAAHVASGADVADMLLLYVAAHAERDASGSVHLVLDDGGRFDVAELAALHGAAARMVVILDTDWAAATADVLAQAFERPSPRSESVALLASAGADELAVQGGFAGAFLDTLDHLAVLDSRFIEDLKTKAAPLGLFQKATLHTVGPYITFESPSLRTELLPAGQGSSVLVRCRTADTEWRLLFDGGPASTSGAVIGRLRERLGPDARLQLVVASHAQEGVLGGLVALLRQGLVELDQLWVNPPDVEHRVRQQLVDEAGIAGIKVRTVTATDGAVTFGPDIRVTILAPDPSPGGFSPPPEWPPEPSSEPSSGSSTEDPDDLYALAATPTPIDRGEENQRSIAILVECAGASVLLPGDLTPDRLEAAVRRLASERGTRRLPVDIVVVPHRGSRGSVTRSLVEAIECRNWMFPGDGSRFRHPDPEAVARVITGAKNARLHFAYRSEVTSRWASSSLQARYGFESLFPSEPDGGIAMEIVAPAPRHTS